MSQLETYLAVMDRMDGWINRESAAIMSMFMEYQTSNGISGNALEIGIWEGKSAALIAAHLDAISEAMILIDPFINKYRDKIIENFRAAGANTTEGTAIFEQAYSEDVLRDPANLERYGRCRLVHIDGGHSGSSVYNDLEIANLVLLRNGLVIVDDVFNPAYPSHRGSLQIPALSPLRLRNLPDWVQQSVSLPPERRTRLPYARKEGHYRLSAKPRLCLYPL